MQNQTRSRDKRAPINLDADEFRTAGHLLIDRIADFLENIPSGNVTPAESPTAVRKAVGSTSIPTAGKSAVELVNETADLLFKHSLINGHPGFLGYITSSPAPIGMLGDLLASAINPNVGSWQLGPAATEIELQTIQWLAEMIGYPGDCGGILVSGGNMANFVGFLAGRKASATWNIREEGLRSGPGQLTVYVSAKTHTWIEKAADLFGFGTDAVRWIPVDEGERMIVAELERAIEDDRRQGYVPSMVVGTAGTVGTGALDPLREIANVCDRENLWYHIDGAYGALAAVLPDAPFELRHLGRADSVALDPHKWLYSPLEVGCVLVKEAGRLRDAFTFQPEYYTFGGYSGEEKRNLFEYGMQNSRGFRALKVWLSIRQVGRSGFEQMIAEDIKLARYLSDRITETNELEPVTCNLSITTFRYVPPDNYLPESDIDTFLSSLNRKVLERIQNEGEAFVSNAVINGVFMLRACVVNFRTSREDMDALPGIVVRAGREVLKGFSGSDN